MTTYKKRMESLHHLVLSRDGQVIGTFGNLKKIVDFVDDPDFLSYWTLIKRKYPIEFGRYRIDKVRHY